jgi:outer membrane receptor protein involved in Fe transport
MSIRNLAASVAAIAIVASVPAPAFAQARTYAFDIPAQDLGSAIRAFAKTSKQQVSFDGALVSGKRSNEVKGSLEADQALARLLEGTGLSYRRADRGVIVLTPSAVGNAGAASKAAALNGEDIGNQQNHQDIVVTGTRIAGHAPAGAPIIVKTRKDFDKEGASTVEDVVAKLPQNFAGTLRAQTLARSAGSLSGAGQNGDSFSTSINLRGLGTGTTLTLINGHRIARGDNDSAMDISLIPLAALDRVEVLLDGASAIYGSDAIGGVVNLITRKDFKGGETRIGAGISSRGDAASLDLAQSLGISGPRGYIFGSYGFRKENSYNSRNRPVLDQGIGDWNVAPNSVSHDLYLAGQYDLTEALTFEGGLDYGHHRTKYTFPAIDGEGFIINSTSTGDGISAYGGLTYRLSNAWRAELNGTYGYDHGIYNATSTEPTFLQPEQSFKSYLYMVEALASGDLFQLNGDRVSLLLGGSFRRENYNDISGGFKDRDQSVAISGELRVPLLPAFRSGEGPGAVMSIAGRYERYERFGGTFNPKIGVTAIPIAGLKIRGTWGTSFRAPTAEQRTPTRVFAIRNGLRTTPDGIVRPISLIGTNPDLGPEKANNWTAGADLTPRGIPGLRLSATYFNIHYKDRIVAAIPGLNFFTAFNDPALANFVYLRSELGSNFDSFVSQFIPLIVLGCPANFIVNGVCTEPASDFGAVGDFRAHNLARLKTDGLDFGLAYNLNRGGDHFSAGLNGTWLFNYKFKTTPTSPTVTVLDTYNNILDFRAVGSLGWQRGPLSTNVSINYADSYKNNLTTPTQDISSFTTVDLNIQYDLGKRLFPKSNKLMFNVDNVFDQKVPRVFIRNEETSALPSYDPSNANPMGRYFKLTFVGNF